MCFEKTNPRAEYDECDRGLFPSLCVPRFMRGASYSRRDNPLAISRFVLFPPRYEDVTRRNSNGTRVHV